MSLSMCSIFGFVQYIRSVQFIIFDYPTETTGLYDPQSRLQMYMLVDCLSITLIILIIIASTYLLIKYFKATKNFWYISCAFAIYSVSGYTFVSAK